jgi:transposase
VPGHLKVVRHVRPKYSCACCSNIVQAAAPSRPIDRGILAPGVLAQLIVSKYAYPLPLYRQAQMYAHEGVELEGSTMSDAVGGASRLLAPLVEALRRYVLVPGKLHGDDIPLPVLAPGKGSTKTGRLWVYVRDNRAAGNPAAPAVWFTYSPDRKGEHPQRHLRDFTGILQADAFAGYGPLYQSGSIVEAACMAHARRKFHDLHVVHASPTTTEALERISALYVIEREVRGEPPEVRQAARQFRAKPLLESMHDWLHDALARLSAKSETSKAIRYMLDRWQALTRYVDDGRMEIDNNIAEQVLRTVAMGRKNWLHCGSDAGGERAAAMYSLIGSAKMNGLDPFAYLRHVLTHLPDHPITRIEEMLPWNVARTLDTVSAERH